MHLLTYALKTIWPSNLAVFYPHPGNSLPAWQIVGAALLIAVAIFLSIRTSKKYPYIAVGLFWYLGTLVPVIGLVQVGEQAMADRYTYLPLIGLFIIIAWGASDLTFKWHYRKIFLWVSWVIIFSVLTVCTFFQTGHWKNGITLFENAIKVTENNYKAQNNLGAAFSPVDLDKAIVHFKEALKIKPDYAMALHNLGIALSDKGNYNEAILHFKKALKINSQLIEARNNLANLLFLQGKPDEAISHYNEILKSNPEYADAHYNLAYVLSFQGKIDEAVLHFKKAITINPEYAKAHYHLGKILINQGKMKRAMFHFAEAIRINPDYTEAYNKIGLILAGQGKYKKAEVFFLKAVQIKPSYTEAQKNIELLNKILSSSEKVNPVRKDGAF
jgi:tetratricopeptide (TPR) repeat protein